ncbi:hypothetical protein [Flavobacterium sp.]|uniref:hypothetical protein n=1 Tax=Flavobacterium sp. TaxID=239 RepID=UPI0040337806
MNLTSAFPEVEIFFSNESFNDRELLSFLTDIDKTYQDKKDRRYIHGLIALKIMQYETFSKEETKAENIVKKFKPIKIKNNLNSNHHPMLSYLRNFSIENIANSLEIRVERLLNLLQQKQIFKQS